MIPEPLTRAMEEALAEGVFPGAVLLVGTADAPIYHRSFGITSLDPKSGEATLETYYDLASLTKPLATAGVALLLIDRGEISLNDPVSRWVPSWTEGERGKATLAHLLSHSSALPAWRPFYQSLLDWQQRGEGKIGSDAARNYLYDLVKKEPLVYPVGTKSEYSDLGFILLGEIL
ncbi:MAG TPA: serine hydrolase domain-containing protein, partial [Nitrospiria bacterium]|nr:serine hydrolase domain-containing protein [Nitrospiria bacterium]